MATKNGGVNSFKFWEDLGVEFTPESKKPIRKPLPQSQSKPIYLKDSDILEADQPQPPKRPPIPKQPVKQRQTTNGRRTTASSGNVKVTAYSPTNAELMRMLADQRDDTEERFEELENRINWLRGSLWISLAALAIACLILK